MPTTLIVLAHPEPRSFNGAWARATEAACRAAGHDVLISDLCALGFDPVEGPGHYPDHPDGAPFDPLKAQEAAAAGALPQDVAAEADKVRQADLIVFHFPLWWFAPPAILKGWTERVFVHGDLHSVAARFDTGQFRGRRALMCVTTGSDADESGPDGREGDTRLLLWPMAMTLRYLGFTVLDPVLAHGIHGYHSGPRKETLETRLAGLLDAQRDLIATLDRRSALPFNADTDFDARGRLRAGAPSHTPFIRRTGSE